MKENVSDKTYKDPGERQVELKEKNSPMHILLDGILFQNPVLVLVLGTCPLLAITTSAKNAVSMGLPALNDSLGIYIPLIVVNCIVLARAEAFAGKKPVIASFFDGLGMGTGFMIALFLMGAVREILGNGTFFGLQLPFFGTQIEPMMFFILPPGGFFVFGILICFAQMFTKWMDKKRGLPQSKPKEFGSCEACGSCTSCSGSEDARK